jgi:hypothetical protein
MGQPDIDAKVCMTDPIPQDPTADAPRPGPDADQVDRSERERLVYVLSQRFAPHLQSAAAAVRGAEHDVAAARDELSRARAAAADERYQSDALVFMRASVGDEVEGLARKTTPKKVRVAYRYLLDRAVELAAGEVQGYASDEAAAQRAREHGVEACLDAEREATQRLEAANAMQERVHDAEQAARQGLALMLEKLSPPSEAKSPL